MSSRAPQIQLLHTRPGMIFGDSADSLLSYTAVFPACQRLVLLRTLGAPTLTNRLPRICRRRSIRHRPTLLWKGRESNPHYMSLAFELPSHVCRSFSAVRNTPARLPHDMLVLNPRVLWRLFRDRLLIAWPCVRLSRMGAAQQ